MTRSTPPSAPPAPTTIGRRVGAYAIDVAVASVLLGMVAGIGAGVVAGVIRPTTPEQVLGTLALVSGVLFAAAVAWLLVYTALQAGRGSIGQRLLGIRLADIETGAPIGFGRALLRNLVWGLAGAIVVGLFSPLFDSSPRRQGWHDKAARGFVGDAKTPEAPAPVEAPAPAVETVDPAPLPPAPVVGPPPRFTSGAVAPVASRTGAVPPVTPYGLISVVPGVGRSEEVEPAGVEPVASMPEPLARVVPVADDATVAAPPRRRAVAAFTWDTGERVAVYGTTLFGRNPSAEDGAAVVAVRDETLSLSKTHFEVGADAEGPWIVDRHSTNGSALVRDGVRTPLEPGLRVSLRPGDRLEFGDRSLHVGEAS